jgi:hypothetical protein
VSGSFNDSSRLLGLVRSLAEDYSDFNAYITYIYKTYSGREDTTGIKIRSSLITMRSFFIYCVQNLARLTSLSKNIPYPSLLAEVKMYASSVAPQIEAIGKEYKAVAELVGQEGGNEAVKQLGDVVADIGRLFDQIKSM